MTDAVDDPNKGKRKPRIDLSKFRLGANWKKNRNSEEDQAYLDSKKGKKGDGESIEDLRWKIKTFVKDIEELRWDMHMLQSMDLLYDPNELYTDNRKRN